MLSPNFVDEYLFCDSLEILKRFEASGELQVLYLSNMLIGKGYLDLLEAFEGLSVSDKCRFKLKFVGGFPASSEKQHFLDRISREPRVMYLGNFIDGQEKRDLYLLSSHIFCLPTYYPYEGQPISILEAYATGCVVLTTQHGGIPDIFVEGKNGFSVLPKNPSSIAEALLVATGSAEKLRSIAIRNNLDAREKYRSEVFRARIFELVCGKVDGW